MEAWIRDLKFSTRLLWKDRGFAVTAILTLAVCIGANAAIFTIVNAIVLQPLPVPDSDSILVMSNRYPNAGAGDSNNSSIPDYYDRLRDVPALDEQAMYRFRSTILDIDGTAQRVQSMEVTPSFFRLLEVPPMHGRTFTEEEAVIGNERKVVLSYGLAEQLYAIGASAVGRELPLIGRPHTIVGVMPPGFNFVNPDVRLWTVAAFPDEQKSIEGRHNNSWFNIGRLKSGATLEQVKQQVDELNRANDQRFPQFAELLKNAGFHTHVEPIQTMIVGDIQSTMYLLWGGALFVLLIGGVNISNLTLARAALRTREMATRLALGAARGQLTRQLLIESVLLSIIGAAGGLVLGALALSAFSSIGLDQLPRSSEVAMDGAVLIFVIAVALGAGLLIGLVPVAHLSSVNLASTLHEEGRSGTGGRRSRAIRRGLVVSQIAFAFVLLIGAGLLLMSFSELLRVDPGFDAKGVVTVSMSLPGSAYPEDTDIRQFMQRSLDAIRAIPGVIHAGMTDSVPFDGDGSSSVILAEGYRMRPGESLVAPRRLTVTPGYFESMGIDLIRGRYFESRDHENAPNAVMVDERLARKFWNSEDPVGKRMYVPDNVNDLTAITENTRFLTVVGVVREVRLRDLSAIGNEFGAYYFPWAQDPGRNPVLTIKTSMDSATLMRAVRAEIRAIDPQLPLFDVQTMEQRTETSLMSRRASMSLAVVFGVIALFLCAIGVYGVLAYLVAQRNREIGIRIALGSTTGSIFRLVLREGLSLVIAGLVIGAAGVLALRSTLQSQVYGIGPTDPVVILGAMFVLGGVALLACSLPARRATRVDPVRVL